MGWNDSGEKPDEPGPQSSIGENSPHDLRPGNPPVGSSEHDRQPFSSPIPDQSEASDEEGESEGILEDPAVWDGDELLVDPTDVELGRIQDLLSGNLGFRRSAEKVREFPQAPGVYLMKDASGVVIYVGKAKNLRSRAGSYFLTAAAQELRTAEWIHEIADIDYMVCASEVDALLTENRLIKDIQPRHNKDLKDDKTFPYLMITTHEDFPRVEVTRTPKDKGAKLYGPFASAGQLRGALQVMQRVFKFRTCSLDIEEGDPRWQWFRPCLLASIEQCTAPCNQRISKVEYRRDIKRLQTFLEGGSVRLLQQLRDEMLEASKALDFEKAARLRDEIQMLENLDRRGEIDTHAQPEVFYIDPKKGMRALRRVLGMDREPRVIEGVDIAHLGGTDTVASVVQFLDGLPFKPGYRRYKIQGVEGIDDFRSIHEVISRRFRRLYDEQESFPDLLMIDGGKGQLNAALAAFRDCDIQPPTLISLAKKEEEIFRPGEKDSIRLGRESFALRLLQYIRDEAHRFAQHYHHILRHKSSFEPKGKKDRKSRRPEQD
ncbi:MAG: excinuclease ABC subunit UvrC [Pirellula sp.]|jgi:excinuclease ABC subunit C